MGHRANYFIALLLFIAAITFLIIGLVSAFPIIVMPRCAPRRSRTLPPSCVAGPRISRLFRTSMSSALSSDPLRYLDDKRNWWNVEVSCLGIKAGVYVQYGPLGYWLPGESSGVSFSDKSWTGCYPLRTGSGSNQDLRYIGITAVVVLAIAVVFAFGALIQSLAALFEFGHAHKHAKRSSHAAICTFALLYGLLASTSFHLVVSHFDHRFGRD